MDKATRRIDVHYFAWVRERVGHGRETLDVPASVATLGDLVGWLRSRGPGYAAAFGAGDVVRGAIDKRHAAPDASIATAREIAFFPPVTGG